MMMCSVPHGVFDFYGKKKKKKDESTSFYCLYRWKGVLFTRQNEYECDRHFPAVLHRWKIVLFTRKNEYECDYLHQDEVRVLPRT